MKSVERWRHWVRSYERTYVQADPYIPCDGIIKETSIHDSLSKLKVGIEPTPITFRDNYANKNLILSDVQSIKQSENEKYMTGNW